MSTRRRCIYQMYSNLLAILHCPQQYVRNITSIALQIWDAADCRAAISLELAAVNLTWLTTSYWSCIDLMPAGVLQVELLWYYKSKVAVCSTNTLRSSNTKLELSTLVDQLIEVDVWKKF